MLVINKGHSGQFHIFRGGLAQQFLVPLEIAAHQDVLVLLPDQRREIAKLLLTKANTWVVVLNAEDLDNRTALAIFNKLAGDRHHLIEAPNGHV